jgi:hypothetical protein
MVLGKDNVRAPVEGLQKQKQILRVAYPNFVGAPSCSAQDDRTIRLMRISKAY